MIGDEFPDLPIGIEESSASRAVLPRAALDAIEAGLFVLDKEGRVCSANAPAERVIGPINQGDKVRFLGDPKEFHKFLGDRRNAKVPQPNGPPISIGYSIYTYVMDGQVLFVVLFRQLARVAELVAERDRLLQLAAVGSAMPSLLHELRNPLAAITAKVELLVEEAESEQLRDDLFSVLQEVREMTRGIQGLGMVGRKLRSNEFGAFDFAVNETSRLMVSSAENRGVRLLSDFESTPLLPFDPGVVRTIVSNLVGNAIAACTKGDQILLSGGVDREFVTLTVTDTGTGMDADTLSKCQELFFTSKRHGSGLGLTLVTRFVREAGGTIYIESRPNNGTSIRIRIPCLEITNTRTQP